MELSFLDLKEREIINVFDGKKLGRIIDIVFNNESGIVRGIVVPGDKKLFHRADDVFIPLDKIKRIGNDVILVGLQREEHFEQPRQKRDVDKNIKSYENYYNRYYPNMISGDRRNTQTANRNYNYTGQNTVTYQQGNNNGKKMVQNINNSQGSYVRLKPLNRKKYK